MRLKEESQTKQALGGDVTIGIVTSMKTKDIEKLFNDIWKQTYVFERQFSRFIPDSELSRFNKISGARHPISSEFSDILSRAKQLSKQTDGLYNPFILPALQRAGYVKSASPGYEKDMQVDYSDLRVETIDKLKIGKNWAQIPYGTALDLGGCGKGYLADKLGQFLETQAVSGFWLFLGGDVLVKGTDAEDNPITIAIQDSADINKTSDWIVQCPTSTSAVATSGTYLRRNQFSDKKWHHIIDPTTLEPAKTDIRLATVCADNATDADVLASCAVILGSKRAPKFLKKHGVTSALLQCEGGDGGSFEVQFGESIVKPEIHKQKEAMYA